MQTRRGKVTAFGDWGGRELVGTDALPDEEDSKGRYMTQGAQCLGQEQKQQETQSRMMEAW